MRKIIIGIFVLIAFLESRAQFKYSFDNYGWNNLLYHEKTNYSNNAAVDSFALTNHLYQIVQNKTYYSKKGKASYSKTMVTFDTKGRSYQRITAEDTGTKQNISLVAYRNYNALGQLENSYFQSPYYKRSELYGYNEGNQIVSTKYFNHKAKYGGQTLISYNENGKEASVTYLNRKNQLYRQYEYFYHSNGQLKQTVLKKKKGKVVLVTDYACDETGKPVTKIKDTAKICSVKSYLPNGNIVSTTHGFNSLGKPYKTVEIRDSFNQLLQYDVYVGPKETYSYGYKYSYSDHKLMKTEVKNLFNPKRAYTRITENDQNGRIIRDESIYQVSKTKQIVWKNIFKYDSAGMITMEQTYKNNLLYSETLYSYQFYQ